ARADLDRAVELLPGDPVAWYLSAALARRQDDLARAGGDIALALALAPEEPEILLEAGNIALLYDEPLAARGFWRKAAEIAPESAAGRAAAAAIEANRPR
ncbi:MAG: hypothetical protein ACFBQW_08525, partial [Sphingomonadaceae bacterium]